MHQTELSSYKLVMCVSVLFCLQTVNCNCSPLVWLLGLWSGSRKAAGRTAASRLLQLELDALAGRKGARTRRWRCASRLQHLTDEAASRCGDRRAAGRREYTVQVRHAPHSGNSRRGRWRDAGALTAAGMLAVLESQVKRYPSAHCAPRTSAAHSGCCVPPSHPIIFYYLSSDTRRPMCICRSITQLPSKASRLAPLLAPRPGACLLRTQRHSSSLAMLWPCTLVSLTAHNLWFLIYQVCGG